MKPELFGAFDIIVGLGWAIIIFGLALLYSISHRDQQHFKWFIPNLTFRITFGLLFGLAYAIILTEGGDTLAYHDGAYHLSNLFWDSPIDYFKEMFTTPTSQSITDHFNYRTGYPPSWIYKEPESFFVSKIISIFSILCFNSYFALTLISATFSAYASWKLFTTLRKFDFCPQWIIILATMFVPTVAFWCSGISKDTFVLGSFYLVFSYLFPLFLQQKKLTLLNFLGLILYGFILYHLRSFMLLALGIPLISALLIRWVKRSSDSPVLINIYRISIGMIILLSLSYFSQSSGDGSLVESNEVLQEVVIIQKDFAVNKTYTGYRYDLGIDDYTTWGLIKATPIAVITAFYRPFLWEANSAFLIISGLESLLLIILTIKFFFFSGSLTKHFSFIRNQEFLVFAILFSLILGFFVGFTSGLFNVLVRFKAPIVVFLIIFFASRNPNKVKGQEG